MKLREIVMSATLNRARAAMHKEMRQLRYRAWKPQYDATMNIGRKWLGASWLADV